MAAISEGKRTLEQGLLWGALLLLLVIGLVSWLMQLPDRESSPGQALSAREVWEHVEPRARAAGLDPDFVYAIIWAESSLNPRARTSVARGLMQLTRGAWETVSERPYREAWNWRTNVEVGIAYLAYCKERLERADRFTYPLLAASYRFGPNHVRRAGYDVGRVNPTRNEIYRALFRGETAPVPRP